jgi:spore coat protein CotF
MNDQERMTDLLFTEKKLSGNYNTFASECTDPKLRGTFLQLLQSSHNNEAELFQAASDRGWYKTCPAEGAKINAAYQKFQAMG